MKKSLVLGALFFTQSVVFSQLDVSNTAKFKLVKSKSSPSQQKSGVVAACGNDTVRYAENKAYYLQAGFTDPTTGGWSVNKLTASTNIVTTAYKVPTGGSVTVTGAEINGLMMLTSFAAISTPTVSTHKVYLYTVDINNKPLVKIDSANINFTEAFGSRVGNFINGPHTLTTDFAIGVKGGATSSASHYLYVAYNQMHVSTDLTNPYGEHLSFKYQAGAVPPGFIDMASNFGDATFDFEFSINPILTYNFSVDFTPSVTSTCPSSPITLTNNSIGYEIFTSHSFSLGAFAKRYNVPEGIASTDLPRDSIFDWNTGIQTNVKQNDFSSISFTTQTLPGTYNDTLYVVALTHDYNYCYQKQIISYTVQPNVTPTFTTIAPFCIGTTAPTLNATSTNTITGTWSPSTISNTATGTYVFTPTAGVCATTYSASVTVNTLTDPTFSIATTICTGTTAPLLNNTSTNVINGTWSPSVVSNTASGTYVFTPTAGQCAATLNQPITVTTVMTTPTFTAIPAFCSGTTAPVLVSTSTNTIAGTWSPSTVNNVNSAVYTFTPLAGSCATTAIASITVTPNVTTDFAAISSFCSGAIAPLLSTTSINSITGTWSPSTVSNTASGTYLFTPTAGVCATTYSASVTVTTNVTPTFGAITSFCSGTTAPVLASTSSNSIVGTWYPSIVDNTTSGAYLFTPSAGVCATTYSASVTVDQPVTPTFASIVDFCSGTTAPVLAATSINSIGGTWSPSTIDNLTVGGGAYVFTPLIGECASVSTISVTVLDCAGIDENSVSKFSVYPNPANSLVKISFSNANSGIISFYSADGKLIETREVNNSKIELFDVKNLNTGIYFIQIGNATEKIVVE